MTSSSSVSSSRGSSSSMSSKVTHHQSFLNALIISIEDYQHEHLYSDAEMSEKVGVSAGLIGKIKSKKTNPSYATLRKLKKSGIDIPEIHRTSVNQTGHLDDPDTESTFAKSRDPPTKK